jgi:alpha-L-rhamnosidase
MNRFLLFALLVAAMSAGAFGSAPQAVGVNPELMSRFWSARWIAPPVVSLKDFGVFHFRRNFTLSAKPERFVIHVSADNRYRLFVNGRPVSAGPARGDTANWRFETVDIAPHLASGGNVLAAVVWNFGEHMPWAQMTDRTGLIVQGDTDAERAVDTGASWKVFRNPAYTPIPVVGLNTFIVVGPGEEVAGERYPWRWEEPGYDDGRWERPRLLEIGTPRGLGTDLHRLLVPREIPPMEETPIRFSRIARADGPRPDDAFLRGEGTLRVPARSRTTLLLDQSHLTTAYPELVVGGGRGSRVTFTYAEALVDAEGRKGHRDEVEGRRILGIQDRFLPDGGDNRLFRPLWWRTYRYVQMEIQTADEPLEVRDLRAWFTAYPFEEKGRFAGDDPALSEIWEVGWRTARLCAGETYFDCPYYEQLQYVGDTRIQALISLYVSGDDRLMRKAIRVFDDSRVAEGLTQSRYPSLVPQLIPPYSLFWVSMVHDYWMHRDDPAFIRSFLPGIRGVLQWYEARLAENGMLGPNEWWNFVDWTEEWPWSDTAREGGVPAGAREGGSSILTLHFAYTLEQAADLVTAFGDDVQAARYRRRAESLKNATYRLCWSAERGLLADTPDRTIFSQHANIFAVLVDLFPPDVERLVLHRILEDSDLIQATFYFGFYLTRALEKGGMGDLYLDTLAPWRRMLELGLTTFAEKPEPTRSDCHAWSASPNYELLATVCGIKPASPGFRSVRIAPHLGFLRSAEGAIPHPEGEIRIRIERVGEGGIKGEIELPAGIGGSFHWMDSVLPLRGGVQRVKVE